MMRRFLYRERRDTNGLPVREYLTDRHEWTTDAGRRKFWPTHKADALRQDMAAHGARLGIVP